MFIYKYFHLFLRVDKPGKNKLPFFLLVLFLYTHNGFSQGVNYPNYYGALSLKLDLGATYPLTDFTISEIDYAGRFSLGYYLPVKNWMIGINTFGTGGYLSGSGEYTDQLIPVPLESFRTGFLSWGGGITIGNTQIYPNIYASFSISKIYFQARPINGNGDGIIPRLYENLNGTVYTPEAGVIFPFSSSFSFNISIAFNFTHTDYLDNVYKGLEKDFYFTGLIGITYYIPLVTDTDDDGIADDLDECPELPGGIQSVKIGCPVDSVLITEQKMIETYPVYFIIDGKYISYSIENEKQINKFVYFDGNLYCVELYQTSDEQAALSELQKYTAMGYRINMFRISDEKTNKYKFTLRLGFFKELKDLYDYQNRLMQLKDKN